MSETTDFAQRYGPWALVTGAAQGLGAAFCAELVQRGSKVFALDRDARKLAQCCERLRSMGGRVEAIELDLSCEELGPRLLEAIGDRELGLLINNAALSRAQPFFEQDWEAMRALQRVNCEAPLLLTRLLGAKMKARGRGGIVLVSSLSMLYGGPLVTHYAATKAFDAILAEGLFEELRGTGVDVTTVLGPLMDTPGMRGTQATGRQAKFVAPERVVRKTLDALGRQARVVVGRDGVLLAGVLDRLLPRALARRIVANQVFAMYPDRGR